MVKVEIDVDQIVTAAVALEVEPGDRLLIMNGIVIGMVEGRRPRPEAVVRAPVPPKSSATRGPSETQLARTISETDLATQDRILAMLRDREMTAHQIAIRLSAERNSERLLVGSLIGAMRERKMIEPAADKRFPPYRLVAQQP